VIVYVLFRWATTSRTRSPDALVTVTDAAVEFPVAELKLPKGVVWCTLKNDVAAALNLPEADSVTATVFAAFAGFTM
jgi:hypothetical protein